MIREIAGRQNHTVKLARKLQLKKHRRDRGLLVAEGLDLLRLAFDAGAHITDVLVRSDLVGVLPSGLKERAGAGALDIGVCDAETLAYASSLAGAADVIFVAREPQRSLSALELTRSLIVFLDGVGDPGNVGTLVRSAVAFGADGVIASPGTADAFGPKALRAGMGAQFLTSLVGEVTAADLQARLARVGEQAGGVPVIMVADPHHGVDVRAVASPAATILVLTAERLGDHRPASAKVEREGPEPERAGPPSDWPGAVRVRIAQARFDSLNVAMAGTILLYELARARSGNCSSA